MFLNILFFILIPAIILLTLIVLIKNRTSFFNDGKELSAIILSLYFVIVGLSILIYRIESRNLVINAESARNHLEHLRANKEELQSEYFAIQSTIIETNKEINSRKYWGKKFPLFIPSYVQDIEIIR